MAKNKTSKQRSRSRKKKEQQDERAQAAAEPARHGDLISKLPDDILARILSLGSYKSAVRASATCRRWKDMYLRPPRVCLNIASLGAAAAQSMEGMLLRRRRDGTNGVRWLRVVYDADVPAERESMARLIGLSDAAALEVCAECADKGLSEGGAGAWSLEVPPSTAELTLKTSDFAIRLPSIHGPGVSSQNLKKFTLEARLVLRWDTIADLGLPSLEDLSITRCTLAAGSGMAITSAAMPRLKRLRITDVTVADTARPGSITVDAEELAVLHMSCYTYGAPLHRDEAQWAMHRQTPYPRAGHTVYSSVQLRVLSWRVCWAYEVRVHSVGRLSDVAVELAYGVMPRIIPEEIRTITKEEAQALMRSIISGLWPGLRHLGGGMKQLLRDVCELDKEQKLLCEISSEDGDDDLMN